MKWSIRYATTKKSIRELQSILPDGWEHVGFTQPEGNRPVTEFHKWMPPQQTDTVDNRWHSEGTIEHNVPLEPVPNARRNRIKTPDVHMVMNPTTGNTAEIYDHSGMNDDARRAYWNPIDHGRLINQGLRRMDKLTTNTNLRMLRHEANQGNMLYNPGICSAQDNSNVDIGAPSKKFVGAHFQVLDHELGHIRHNRNPENFIKFANIITDHHNANSKPRDQVNPGWVDSHMRKHTNTSDMSQTDASHFYSKDFITWGKMPNFLDKVVKSTATDSYGASSLMESYAQHHAHYINGVLNPLTQRLGKELGWDKPIQ